MSQPKRLSKAAGLGKKASGLILNNLLTAATQFFILVLIARVFGAQTTGEYSLAQGYILPAAFLASLAFKQRILMDVDHQIPYADFIATRLVFATLILGAAITVCAVFEAKTVTLLAASLAVIKFMDGSVENAVSLLQRHKQIGRIASTALTRFMLIMTAFGLTLWQTQNLIWALIALTTALIVHYYAFEYRYCRRVESHFGKILTIDKASITRRLQLARSGLPLSIAMLIGAMQLTVIRLAIDRATDTATLGHFSAVLQLVMVGNIVITSLSQSLLPAYTRDVRDVNRKSYIDHVGMAVAAIVCIVLIGTGLSWWLGGDILVLLYGTEFAGLGSLLVWAAVSCLPFFLNPVLTSAALACGMERQQFLIYSIGLIATLVAGYWSIPHYGAAGGFMAMGCGALAQVLLLLFSIVKYWRKSFDPPVKS